MDLGAARERLRVARALPRLPLIRAALANGEVSYAKVRAMTRAATPDNEATLLAYARHGTASHLERIVRGYRSVAPDPATSPAEADAAADAVDGAANGAAEGGDPGLTPDPQPPPTPLAEARLGTTTTTTGCWWSRPACTPRTAPWCCRPCARPPRR